MKTYICNYKRTPVGGFLSKLSSFSATQLAEISVKNTLNEDIKSKIEYCIFGNVLSAGNGQNISRQICLNSGLSNNIACLTLNMVCSSGMESIIYAHRLIKSGDKNCILVGGTESMSNSPFLLKNLRKGKKFGDEKMVDSMLNDGLTDAFSQKHMGVLAEDIIKEYNLTREELDNYAIRSYENSNNAYQNNFFKTEIIPIELKNRNQTEILDYDEEIKNFNPDKLKTLKPVFDKNGTITPGNASTLSDGAFSMLIVSEEIVNKHNLDVICEIIDIDESAQEPYRFTETPYLSIEKLLKNNNLNIRDIGSFEINEAFASVPLICQKKLNIPKEKLNTCGGAISIGHPIGSSGGRIVGTLGNILNKGEIGIASICNGGGGATSILLKKL